MAEQEHLAIASVPFQNWGELYEQAKALSIGTIFRELDKPFFASEQDFGNIPRSCPSQRPGDPEAYREQSGEAQKLCRTEQRLRGEVQEPDGAEQRLSGVPQNRDAQDPSSRQQGRECLMLQVMEIGFMMDDIRLYMDTHPEDKDGLQLLKQVIQRRKQLMKDFAEEYYPLTMDCMAELYEKNPQSDCYCWKKGPMPWEGACV